MKVQIYTELEKKLKEIIFSFVHLYCKVCYFDIRIGYFKYFWFNELAEGN